MSNKLSEVAMRDPDCAQNIEEFIIVTQSQTSINSSSDSNDHYSSDYYDNFDFNVPQEAIDSVCAPNCRNQFDEIYQQCTDAVSVPTMDSYMHIS